MKKFRSKETKYQITVIIYMNNISNNTKICLFNYLQISMAKMTPDGHIPPPMKLQSSLLLTHLLGC